VIPAGVRPALFLAAGAVAIVVVQAEFRRRAEAAELRMLALDVSALRTELASTRTPTGATPPADLHGRRSCALDSDALQAIASVVSATVARDRPAPAASATEASAELPRSLEAEKAVAHAAEVLGAALQRGRLSRADVMQMRTDLANGHATPDEADDLRRRIAQAVNAQTLVPEDPPTLYA
jgi:hypothetical protein